jgi:carboxyl-terminal processing protease
MDTNLARCAKSTLVAMSLALALAVGWATPVAAEAVGLSDLAGVWQMRGYGKVFDISPQRLAIYDVTDVSCMREKEQPIAEAQNEFDRIALARNGFTLFAAGGITRYAFERLASLPDRCRSSADQPLTDPELNFWTLWHAFRENYAFFDLRQVRWDDVYAQFRPKIGAATTQDELFEVFSQVLTALNDGHVGLSAGEREFSSGGHGELFEAWAAQNSVSDLKQASRQYKDTVRSFIVKDVLHDKASHGANDILWWGWAAPGVGYINTVQMYMGAEENGIPLPRQIELVDEAMTRALTDLRQAKALIVDARFNPGGHDAVALRIMGYLTREKRLAFTKKAVVNGGYTETQEIHFEPHGKRQFTGPVYYLQSGNTVSAAEIFSLAMMALPNVTRVGTPTYGVLSDILPKKLPNGWTVGLSNELYVAVDGQLYEGRGIPPTVAVEPRSAKNFHERMQLDVDTALDLINKKRSVSR